MQRSPTDKKILDQHAALACRLIQSQRHLRPVYQWLARPNQHLAAPSPNPKTISTIELLLDPLSAESDPAEQRETQSAKRWIASICELLVNDRSTCQEWRPHLLAAGLLPLYRSLATGKLREGFLQCRRRLSESLVLLGVIEQLDLDEFLKVTVNEQVSPHRILREQIKVDLNQIDYLLATSVPQPDSQEDQCRADAIELLRDFESGSKLSAEYQTPGWADPQTLWMLSNELLSARSDLVLPRTWIDTPVPWGKIIEHWHELLSILKQPRLEASDAHKSPSHSEVGHGDSRLSTADSAPQLDYTNNPSNASQASNELRDPTVASIREMELLDQALLHEVGDEDLGARLSPCEHLLIPKIVIGEILGLEDPAFHNVVRRQVAVCRMEARSVCLSMLVVLPDNDVSKSSKSQVRELAPGRWQQKIVNWLAVHPSMKEPIAFVTHDGQLIVTVLDVERNEMTTILRQGLVEVLTGSQSGSSNTLCQVNIPARFHVGMASTSAPSASFNHQELIQSAHRCLTVAQRLGKASIKSIEVF